MKLFENPLDLNLDIIHQCVNEIIVLLYILVQEMKCSRLERIYLQGSTAKYSSKQSAWNNTNFNKPPSRH